MTLGMWPYMPYSKQHVSSLCMRSSSQLRHGWKAGDEIWVLINQPYLMNPLIVIYSLQAWCYDGERKTGEREDEKSSGAQPKNKNRKIQLHLKCCSFQQLWNSCTSLMGVLSWSDSQSDKTPNSWTISVKLPVQHTHRGKDSQFIYLLKQ